VFKLKTEGEGIVLRGNILIREHITTPSPLICLKLLQVLLIFW